ncbi:MAG: hybrid sensor histidine kinase/response regulator [Rhizobiales bacterium]|nr:hybrid sensor histidine kinase/response regulator [Hyphomicrobiales bacterium]
MLQGWVAIVVALAYIGLLFLVASYGDRSRRMREGRPRMLIYPLSLAIYCTSWTFFGSVGLASKNGLDFLTIYVGPAVMVGLCTPLMLRVVRLAKAQNITSIADFIAARYGKSQAVSATVTLIAILGTIPYIALQLKAVSSSLATILEHGQGKVGLAQPVFGDLSLFVALAMATFAVLFGTRHADATEHQHGLMLAIATESIVKLVAFLAVGLFVTVMIFDGPHDLFARAMDKAQTAEVLTRMPPIGNLLTMTLLSFFAIILLPRQFHVSVVENNGDAEVRRAAWLFPVYLVLINLFVVPIALAGMLTFPRGYVDSDMFVLALPLSAGSEILTLVAFVGGLSAATAMVIVESVALAIMMSNDIVMPLMLKRRAALVSGPDNVGQFLLAVRRAAILGILALAFIYYRVSGDAQLASIGLLSFAAIAQFAPAFFGGLFWRRGTARGAIAGMTAGIAAWIYTLLLPSFADAGLISAGFVADGPWGVMALRPQALFGLDLLPLTHGVVWSLTLNVIAYVGVSLMREPASIERLQAIGEERARGSFESFASTRRISLEPQHEADIHLLRYAEHLLASAIGGASSRLVLSLLLRQRTVSTKAALKLLDDASAAIHHNREILQIALDHVLQGIAVFDKDMHLICWNRQFGEILDLPPQRVRVGATLDEVVRDYVGRMPDVDDIDAQVRERHARYLTSIDPFLERFPERDLVIEIRANRMPDGGLVTTFTDMTPSVAAAEALEQSNVTLERRVRERTEELTRLNAELGRAKAEADEANISKTRFLAAASHDILQPLNAARLYVTSLVEQQGHADDRLVSSIDASLEAVEEILSVLLDISRLDAGAMKPEVAAFPVGEMLRQLEVEFMPLARAKGLDLTFVPCSLAIKSDRRLLRRLLQNLVSNAIKYTPQGRVLIGCRRFRRRLRIEVYDTGLGIPPSKRRAVFKEFQRLDQGARVARGLGLGLSIVERIARVLDHKVDMQSALGRGSHFWVDVPIASSGARVVSLSVPKAADSGTLSGMTVLCIDNEPKILEGMQILLSGWGCRVLIAPDVETALSQMQNAGGPLNGLLVDYHLDHGNGIEAIAAMRAQAGADLPAILITADRSPRVRQEARASGVVLLNKPVKPAALRALLAQWSAQRIAAAE